MTNLEIVKKKIFISLAEFEKQLSFYRFKKNNPDDEK